MLSIDALRDVARQLSGIPTVVAIGLLVIVMGVGIDLGVHALVAHDHADGGFDASEHMAHLIVVVGMTLTLAGVVAHGIRLQVRSDPVVGRRKEYPRCHSVTSSTRSRPRSSC